MTQYARPDSDVSDGSWYNSADNQTNLYSYIDEASASDSDYIYATDDFGSTNTCILGLGDVTDPSSAADHKFTIRTMEDAGMSSVSVTVTLQQGTTTIRAASHNPGSSFSNHTTILTTAQANSISDYSALRLKIESTDGMGMGTTTSVSHAYFECPDAEVSTQTGKAFLMFLDI